MTIIAIVVAMACAGLAAPVAGEAFPDLRKAGLKGTLPDLSGKVVLVDFWASWCGPCKKSFPVMEQLHQDYKDKGLIILAINVDEAAGDMNKFLKEHPVTFAVLHDAKHSLVKAAGIEAMPTSFLLDGKGNIVSIHKGFNGKETEQLLRKEIEAQISITKGGQAK